MTPEKTIEEKLQKLARAIGSEERFVENIMSRIETEPSYKADRATKMKNQPIIRRFIMNRFTKFAVAALIIIAIALGINFLDKSTPSAYAIEQTIQANHSVRYLHIKSFEPDNSEPKEFWVEFYDNGNVKNVRMQFPLWASPDDGPKVVVWQENKAKVWFKQKGTLLTVNDQTVAERMLKLVEECDPRLAVERLYEREQQGKVKVEIDEPSDKSKPIIVTATYLPGSSSPNKREVLFVDQATKLVTAVEFYQLKDGEYRYTGMQEYCNYNQPIEAKMFTLDEVPADVMRIDQTIQEVGLAQGKLADEEIAVEVVRQFFEALIASDYAKAGKLLEGIPADKIKEAFGDRKFLRIISIGPVAPHPIPETKGLVVPCTVEVEKDGQISQWKLEQLAVRQVYNQPGRWTIFGGI
jgi:hypothetical protein